MSQYKLNAEHNHTTECFKRMSSRVCLAIPSSKAITANKGMRQWLTWAVLAFASLGGAVACIAQETPSEPFIASDKMQLISNDVCGNNSTAIWINEVNLECFKEL